MGYRYRLLIDENVEHIESDLREQGHDATHVEHTLDHDRSAAECVDTIPSL